MSRIVLAIDAVDETSLVDVDFLSNLMKRMNRPDASTPWVILKDGELIDGEGRLDPPVVTFDPDWPQR